MDRVLVVIIFFAICGYGFIRIRSKIVKHNERLEFAAEFMRKLSSYVESRGHNLEDYGWMIHRSNKMQNNLGSQGVLHRFSPPYQDVIFSNYPIVLNMLPDLRARLEDELLLKVAYQYANILQDTLVRHIGSTEDNLEIYENELKNPFKWLRDGVRELVSVPVFLLSWLGVFSESLVQSFLSSVIFKAASGVIALVGFISAIITIAIGWEQFYIKLASLLAAAVS